MINAYSSWDYDEASVISREIRPLVILYPPPIQKRALSGRRGRSAHAYGTCAPFYCISIQNIYVGGGINAARGLNSRDIAEA